ncbi:tRNA adenosine(34) deaminase TadA [Granulosicoccus antarcticus]|uniref:tRNA-specific adenosine deaminase n=1 Tax=Granulosicoccus antarcticus IMCC3135 TaxID=1192854 RepID=A0A2Z2NMC0_9GAMM|nr:tRNA adenosine(34) deaminase TadA [Granulosicoccus antarcticus]ASJ72339.1 tRNA-specific adenosine deaminase [Granulosicoccus antarcticus IMCC3135]
MISANQQRIDAGYMAQALELAKRAGESDEVPVGALVVLSGQVLGVGYNRCIIDHDPCGHAEVLALQAAAKKLQSSRLDGATLYVTLEPCLMCCGALLQARVARLVFGAREPRTGGVVSIHEALRLHGVDHHIAVTEGVAADEAALMMQLFFQRRR